jgi:hypothetical protein
MHTLTNSLTHTATLSDTHTLPQAEMQKRVASFAVGKNVFTFRYEVRAVVGSRVCLFCDALCVSTHMSAVCVVHMPCTRLNVYVCVCVCERGWM